MAQSQPVSAIAPRRDFHFTFDPSLAPWNVTLEQWLRDHDPEGHLYGVATGVVVFKDHDVNGNKERKVLLVQRASTDSMPDLWEIPGGAADVEDETILHAAARELWEESGLEAGRLVSFIPEVSGWEDGGADIAFDVDKGTGEALSGMLFRNRTRTRKYCRFAFVGEVDWRTAAIVLDPNEHQDFVWASEEEVRSGRVGEKEIPFTVEGVKVLLLKAFALRG